MSHDSLFDYTQNCLGTDRVIAVFNILLLVFTMGEWASKLLFTQGYQNTQRDKRRNEIALNETNLTDKIAHETLTSNYKVGKRWFPLRCFSNSIFE
jgi:hypothetical protein